MSSRESTMPAPVRDEAPPGPVTAGYVFAVLTPIVGFVIGVALLFRRREATASPSSCCLSCASTSATSS